MCGQSLAPLHVGNSGGSVIAIYSVIRSCTLIHNQPVHAHSLIESVIAVFLGHSMSRNHALYTCGTHVIPGRYEEMEPRNHAVI